MPTPPRSMRLELLDVVAIGLPFCGFKVLTGLSLWSSGAGPLPRLLAAALIALGGLDAVINGANLAVLLANGRRATDACLLSLATRPLRAPGSTRGWQDLGNSLDVLLSFTLVAAMLGFGRLRSMPADQLAAWNACVILNVLGAGLGRLGESVRNLARGARSG